MIDFIKRLLADPDELDKSFKAGYDSGLNGSNMENCHFKHFSTQLKTSQWDKGVEAGKQAKLLIEEYKKKC